MTKYCRWIVAFLCVDSPAFRVLFVGVIHFLHMLYGGGHAFPGAPERLSANALAAAGTRGAFAPSPAVRYSSRRRTVRSQVAVQVRVLRA